MTQETQAVERQSGTHQSSTDLMVAVGQPTPEAIGSRRILWGLLSLVAVLEIGFAWWTGSLPLVSRHLFYSPTEVATIARSLDPSLRDCCRWFNTADLALITVYTVALVAWLRLLGRRCVLCCWVCSLGVLPGLCHAVETVSVAVLLASATPERSTAIWFAVLATPTKWAVTAMVAALIATLELGLDRRGPKRWLRWIQKSTPLGLRRPRTIPLQ